MALHRHHHRFTMTTDSQTSCSLHHKTCGQNHRGPTGLCWHNGGRGIRRRPVPLLTLLNKSWNAPEEASKQVSRWLRTKPPPFQIQTVHNVSGP